MIIPSKHYFIHSFIHFVLGNVQVEVTDLPADWVEEGIDKIRSIANAYGDPAGEIPTEKVYQKGENEFVIVYKQPKYATKMFETLHLRQIDEFIVKVSEPHPIEWITTTYIFSAFFVNIHVNYWSTFENVIQM